MTSKELCKVFICTYSDVPIESGIINDEISFSRILNAIGSCDQYIFLKRKIRYEKCGTKYMVFKIVNDNHDNLSLNDTTINDSDIKDNTQLDHQDTTINKIHKNSTISPCSLRTIYPNKQDFEQNSTTIKNTSFSTITTSTDSDMIDSSSNKLPSPVLQSPVLPSQLVPSPVLHSPVMPSPEPQSTVLPSPVL